MCSPTAFRKPLMSKDISFWPISLTISTASCQDAPRSVPVCAKMLTLAFPLTVTHTSDHDKNMSILLITFARIGYSSKWQMTNDKHGIGPDCMTEGDMIVALLGGSSPYALRTESQGYRFLGPVYINEVMDGKYFRAQYDNRTPVQQYTLI